MTPTRIADKPLAQQGLISYRCRCPFGWVLIGATDDADAMREALRSTDKPGELQVWRDGAYRTVSWPDKPGDTPAKK